MEFTLGIDTIAMAVAAILWLGRLEAVSRSNNNSLDQRRDDVANLYQSTAAHDKCIAVMKTKIDNAAADAKRASEQIDRHVEKCDRGGERIWNAIEGPTGLTGRITVLEQRGVSPGDD